MASSKVPGIYELSYPRHVTELSYDHIDALRAIPPITARPTACLPSLWTQEKETWMDGWMRSTHVVPANVPRKVSVKVDYADAKELVGRKRMMERAEGTGDDGMNRQERLLNVVERYYRKDGRSEPSGSTLFVSGANGLPRRSFEPALKHFISCTTANVTEVWIFEHVNQGDSAVLNGEKLSDVLDYLDLTADILNFLINYLPPEVSSEALPAALPPNTGRKKVIGIGHSIGGTTMARAAIQAPHLFATLVLVDPILIPPRMGPCEGDKLVGMALKRKSTWGTMDEARKSLSKNPFFRSLDKRVLGIYLDEAVVVTDDGSARLKQSPAQEALGYAENLACYETWQLLSSLPPNVGLRWIMAGRTGAADVIGGEDIARHTVWRRPTNSLNVRMGGVGHLMIQEAPEEFGRILARIIEDVEDNENSYNETKL